MSNPLAVGGGGGHGHRGLDQLDIALARDNPAAARRQEPTALTPSSASGCGAGHLLAGRGEVFDQKKPTQVTCAVTRNMCSA